MISDTFSSLYVVEKIKSLFATPVGVFLHTVVTEIVGMLILLMFLSTVLELQVLPMILPAIIALNGAAGGYRLGGSEIVAPWRKTALTASAVLLTICGCAAIIVFCPWEPLVSSRCLVWGLVALVFTFFGSWIARENNRLIQRKSLKENKGGK